MALTGFLPHIRESTLDALAIVFPVGCAGCGRPDRVLCSVCQRALTPAVRSINLVATGREPLVVWAALTYEAPIPAILHAFKESGRTNLARALAVPLAAAARMACHSLSPQEPLAFVCPPSTRLAHRSRGYVPLRVLTRRSGIRPARLLAATGVRLDQSLLGREERWQNLTGSLRAVAAGGPVVNLVGRRVILLDDVVTTGATLHECARALRAAGAIVLGAAVVAQTERHLPVAETERNLSADPRGQSLALSGEPETNAGMEFFGTLSAKLRDR